MNAERFQNALRIMYSLDEVSSVLPTLPEVQRFHRNPAQSAVSMDADTWAKVYALIEARQTHIHKATDGNPDKCAKCGLDIRNQIHARAGKAEGTA